MGVEKKSTSIGSNDKPQKSASCAGKVIPVRVAVRVRPLVPRELNEGCNTCLEVIPQNNQIVIPPEKAFTYDYTFPSTASQADVYTTSVSKLVQQLFKGYNVTVLAYGQTGSGKTHSMGTNYVMTSTNPELEMGVIPRAVNDIFDGIAQREECQFTVKVSFVELYSENLYDLLNGNSREDSLVDIRETQSGDIKIQGLTEVPVSTLRETMKCLERGSMCRATGATAMNAHSSRSHAIFSIHMEQLSKTDSNDLVNAKFTLVDLAGSERAKKTGATGQRFKEGVTINRGLLALGNVISALCDAKEGGHIPYRDSKLTRLLQDSLGGNSHTLMLACVSPADNSNDETVNTLRYADRARKIKNKPIINMDPQAAEIARLKQQMQDLRMQLLSGGMVDLNGSSVGSAISSVASSEEVRSLREENSELKKENLKLLSALRLSVEENSSNADKALMAEEANEKLKESLAELRQVIATNIKTLDETLAGVDVTSDNTHLAEQLQCFKGLETKLDNIQCTQTDNERLMVTMEMSRHNDNTIAEENKHEESSSEESAERAREETAFMLKQSQLSQQLRSINRDLASQENLLHQVRETEESMQAMKYTYERSIKELEEQINSANKEKYELKDALSRNSANPSKTISEQRRKRVQELEGTINRLQRQVLEKNRVLKEKEQAEKKVQILMKDIDEKKKQRVKLVKQLKEDGERFRRVTSQKDKEISKLKQAERKKEMKMVKMERETVKKETYLRRRLEETAAVNKKLKEALERQKSCADKRATSKDTEGLQVRLRVWLENEIDVVSVKIQAKSSLQILMEDRKALNDQLQRVKADLLSPDISSDFKKDLLNRQKQLENERDMRSASIADIQQKCNDDIETKERLRRKRFEGLSSMVEAKVALEHLFETASTIKADFATQAQETKMLQDQLNELSESYDELKAELLRSQDSHRQEMYKLSVQQDERTLLFLKQMAESDTDKFSSSGKKTQKLSLSSEEEKQKLLERLALQQQEIERMSHLHTDYRHLEEKWNQLQEQLESKKAPAPSVVVTAPSMPPPKKKTSFVDLCDEDLLDNSFESDLDDANDDPDWRKTPLFRRIRALKRKTFDTEETKENADPDDRTVKLGTKRNSDGGAIKCGCASDCNTKRCKCRKSGSACCASCKCNAITCVNKTNTSGLDSTENSKSDETELNSTFDLKPVKKMRVTTSSSTLTENTHLNATFDT